MSDQLPPADSLVLYRSGPARVLRTEDKIEIALRDGERKRVRAKDLTLIHPGPFHDFTSLAPRTGEVEEAWEMLEGETTNLADLAELVYGEFTPGTAWAAWELLADGLYFRGTPDAIDRRDAAAVDADRAQREAKAAAERAWSDLLERLRAGVLAPGDERHLTEVERLAYGRITRCRILRELGRPETPEAAHRLLLRVGQWDETVNPHPARLDAPMGAPDLPVPALPDEPRRDLTHLTTYAIDDEGNQDPDDALSLDGDTLWVHVADVAALVAPDSDLDLEARARGANLYLPERIVPMLPTPITERLGLGLDPVSPALSFGIRVDAEGRIVGTEIVASWVRVHRITYAEAEGRLAEPILADIKAITDRFRARRQAQGAAAINLPEVSVKIVDDEVVIRPLPPLASRALVMDAMLLAGEAAGRFALAAGIPFPYSTQPAPDEIIPSTGLAAMFAARKGLKRSQLKSVAEPHAGLGLDVYTQATSPLRRYLDLVAHQQLRAHLRGEPPIPVEAMVERVGAAEALIGNLRRAERASNTHWKLVYLKRRPGWRGAGVLVEKRGGRGTVIIPELGLDVAVSISGVLPLDAAIPLSLSGVDLPGLEVHFQC